MSGSEPASSRALQFVATAIGTGLGVAYLTPFAKATLASAVAVGIYAALAWGEEGVVIWLFPLIAVTTLAGIWASSRVASTDEPDPSRVVIDEFAGQWVALIFLPVTWQWMVAAFILFRVFDVLKPFGIRRLERIPGGWGIMLDDLGAGLACAIILNVARFAIEAVN